MDILIVLAFCLTLFALAFVGIRIPLLALLGTVLGTAFSVVAQVDNTLTSQGVSLGTMYPIILIPLILTISNFVITIRGVTRK